MKKITFLLSALLISIMSIAADYVKITSAPSDWSGEYLLVYEGEDSASVWTGVDAANCYVSATVNDNTISGNDFVTITLAPMEGGYSVKVNGGENDGKYISGTSGSNKLNFGAETTLNTLAYEEGSVKIVSNTSVLRYNSAKDQLRFRYFKSTTYTDQKVIQLYKNLNNTGEEDPENPGQGGEEVDPETPGEGIIFDFTTKEGLEALGIAYPTETDGSALKTNLEEGKEYTQDGVSLIAKYGSTATRVWLASSGKMDLRHYKGGVLTFAAPAGKVITQVVFDGADLTGLTTLVDKSWTGTAAVVEIPAADDAQTIKINTITISLADAAADFVATPAIAGETDFMDKTTVTITAEDGLKVYYTLDGTEPTNASTEYTAPFELTATTTVKAVAYDGDNASAVVEKTFTKMSILTCTEAVALCTATATTESYIVRGYVTEMIEAYNDKYKNITFWMADAQDGGQVLQAFRVKPVSDTDQEVKAGDYVEVVGTLVLYTKDGVSTPEINAGGSVKILEAAPTTAIDNVTIDQNITKFFENGQLVIIKNGVRYNAQGQMIK